MKVIVYEPWYDLKHQMVLQAFAEGCGAEVRDVRNYIDCDVAVIFGMAKRAVPDTMTKLPIIKRHRAAQRLIVIDSAPLMRGQYWAVGWNNLGGRADFCNEGMSIKRWESFAIRTYPFRHRVNAPIVVVGQVPHDANVQDTDHVSWVRAHIAFYLRHGFDVLFRPHPKVTDASIYGVNEALFDRRELAIALKETRCFVTYNSNLATEAVIAGVQTITFDQGSFAYNITAHRPEAVFDPFMPARESWLASLAYTQWNLEELRAGQAWQHLTRR